MDARERVAPERRASIILGPFGKGEQWYADAIKLASQQIKEAEQAAYERAAQYIADKEARAETRVIAACASLWSVELRILAREPAEVA